MSKVRAIARATAHLEDLLLVALGVAVAAASTRYTSAGDPGPGLVPMALGGCLIIIGALGLVSRRSSSPPETPGDWNWGRVWRSVAPTLAYVILLHWITFVASTLIFAALQAAVVSRSRRQALGIVATGLVVGVAVLAVFENLLAVQLP